MDHFLSLLKSLAGKDGAQVEIQIPPHAHHHWFTYQFFIPASVKGLYCTNITKLEVWIPEYKSNPYHYL